MPLNHDTLGGLPADRARRRSRERGQVLPIFVMLSVVLLGGAALLTDAAWWWVNQQRMQRAADAGALAGAIHLPGNEVLAFSRAREEAAKNGYDSASGATVTPRRDPGDPRRLVVDIAAPVDTHFAKVFAMSSVDAAVSGAASYVLPVPMGSPQSHYGVFGKLRTPGGGTTETSSLSGATGWTLPTWASGGDWTATSGTVMSAAGAEDSDYAQTATDNATQRFGGFSLRSQIPLPGANQTVRIDGIEVLLDDTYVTAACTDTYVEAHLSVNGGGSFNSAPSPSTANDTPDLATTVPSAGNEPYGDYIIGSDASTSVFPIGRSWQRDDFADSVFQLRLRAQKGGSCSGAQVRVDQVRVRVHYTVVTTVFIPDANITDPYGAAITPTGLWGTFINQGADKINGDAYLPKWDPRTSGLNEEYDPEQYYNYAVKFPAGSEAGEVWVYDPVFCATSGNGNYGTGDRWFSSDRRATSAYYTLYDTANTPYIYSDDTPVASSGSLFADIRASDESLYGPDLGPAGASTDCSEGATNDPHDGRYWHNRWWKLASGLQGGKTYRLHTRSTDPDDASAMDDANGHNSFALWSRASGGAPKIHGLSAMEAFTPLNGGGAATFYLAQIDAEHAGKTMVINLWDPGDTGSLSAALRILRPTTTNYVETPFSYSAEQVASGASSCASRSGVNVMSVTTNSGGNKLYNGCWLTIEIPLPVDYDAPRPASEDPSVEGGWWKIRYVMGGSSSDTAFDLTTWQVELRGNPVHLVLTD